MSRYQKRFYQDHLNCSCGYCQKEILSERAIVEARKQLFNGEKSKKSVEGGEKNEAGLRKRQTYDPNLPHPSLPRLITRCWGNIQEWNAEQEEKERLKFKKIEESMK